MFRDVSRELIRFVSRFSKFLQAGTDRVDPHSMSRCSQSRWSRWCHVFSSVGIFSPKKAQTCETIRAKKRAKVPYADVLDAFRASPAAGAGHIFALFGGIGHPRI